MAHAACCCAGSCFRGGQHRRSSSIRSALSRVAAWHGRRTLRPRRRAGRARRAAEVFAAFGARVLGPLEVILQRRGGDLEPAPAQALGHLFDGVSALLQRDDLLRQLPHHRLLVEPPLRTGPWEGWREAPRRGVARSRVVYSMESPERGSRIGQRHLLSYGRSGPRCRCRHASGKRCARDRHIFCLFASERRVAFGAVPAVTCRPRAKKVAPFPSNIFRFAPTTKT